MSIEAQLERDKLEDWLRILGNRKELAYIEPEDSAYNAIIKLIQNRIHRLPIIDPATGDVLQIVTPKRLLKYLHNSFLDHIEDLPPTSYLHESIIDLGVGTHEDIITVKEEASVMDALDIFVKHRISGIPIVDGLGRIVDIYSKFDVINIAVQKTYSRLDMTLKEANQERNQWFRLAFL